MVLSFDTSNEVFHAIKFPNDLSNHRRNLCLLVCNDFVYLVYFPSRGSYSLEMWVMDVDFNCIDQVYNSCWKRCPSIKFIQVTRFMNFWKSDEIIVLYGCGGIGSYNVGTQRCGQSPVHWNYFLYSGNYVSSLVSVKGKVQQAP